MINENDGVYNVVRLCDLLNTNCSGQSPENQIMIMLERNGTGFCLLVDELIGDINIQIKMLSEYCDGEKYISLC